MHFYQLATDRGFTIIEVVAWVFVVNIALSALAILTVVIPGRLSNATAIVGGAIVVAFLLSVFARGRK